jgi:hypothetical protein
MIKMRLFSFQVWKVIRAQIAACGGRQGAMLVTSTFPAARRHLEEAYRLLDGEDELSHKSRQALEILIDAFLAAEYGSGKNSAKVIDFPADRVMARR